MARGDNNVFIDPARGLSRTLRQRLRHAFYATAIYRQMLKGRHPTKVIFVPPELWPGDPEEADKIFRGEYSFAGRTISAPNDNPWRVSAPSQGWADALHSFSWLRHFAAQGGEAATRQAENLIKAWLVDFDSWHPVAWQPELIARRLIAWLTYADIAARTSDLIYHSAVMNSMVRQARHLARTAATAQDGLPRLIAAIGLIYSGFCLPDGERRLRRGMALLGRETDRLILPDGGIATRNPSDQFEALKAMVALKVSLIKAGQDVPDFVQQAIDRMAPMVRFFRHGDGKFALFNGSYEEDSELIDDALNHARATGRPVNGAIYSGYQRVQAEDVTLIMDAGAPPPGELSLQAHAGLNSFELSVGPDRMIVNCGSSEQMGAEGWQRVSRATAAHSTMVLNNRNSCSILENQRIGRRPSHVRAIRDEMDNQVSLDVSHDGYGAIVGYEHNRILRISNDGTEIAGVDAIVPTSKAKKRKEWPFDIRFHLHPAVEAAPSVDGGAVDLMLPHAGIWRLECTDGLMVEESIYLGQRGKPRNTKQLVINGRVKGNTAQIVWRLSKLSS